jgi:hypothetical protein
MAFSVSSFAGLSSETSPRFRNKPIGWVLLSNLALALVSCPGRFLPTAVFFIARLGGKRLPGDLFAPVSVRHSTVFLHFPSPFCRDVIAVYLSESPPQLLGIRVALSSLRLGFFFIFILAHCFTTLPPKIAKASSTNPARSSLM